MAFEGLSEKLNAAFKRLRGKGRLTENDVREAMREVRLALLEADVSYKVVKEFVATVTERSVGTDVLDSLTPAQQVVKIVTPFFVLLLTSSLFRPPSHVLPFSSSFLVFLSRPSSLTLPLSLSPPHPPPLSLLSFFIRHRA